MNMPCISRPAYYKQLHNILEAQESENVAESKAGMKLRNFLDVEDYDDLESDEDTKTDQNKIIDVIVSFDRT